MTTPNIQQLAKDIKKLDLNTSAGRKRANELCPSDTLEYLTDHAREGNKEWILTHVIYFCRGEKFVYDVGGWGTEDSVTKKGRRYTEAECVQEAIKWQKKL